MSAPEPKIVRPVALALRFSADERVLDLFEARYVADPKFGRAQKGVIVVTTRRLAFVEGKPPKGPFQPVPGLEWPSQAPPSIDTLSKWGNRYLSLGGNLFFPFDKWSSSSPLEEAKVRLERGLAAQSRGTPVPPSGPITPIAPAGPPPLLAPAPGSDPIESSRPPVPPPTDPPSPSAGGRPSHARRFCPYCGASTETDYAFCESCGKELPVREGAPSGPGSATTLVPPFPAQGPTPKGSTTSMPAPPQAPAWEGTREIPFTNGDIQAIQKLRKSGYAGSLRRGTLGLGGITCLWGIGAFVVAETGLVDPTTADFGSLLGLIFPLVALLQTYGARYQGAMVRRACSRRHVIEVTGATWPTVLTGKPFRSQTPARPDERITATEWTVARERFYVPGGWDGKGWTRLLRPGEVNTVRYLGDTKPTAKGPGDLCRIFVLKVNGQAVEPESESQMTSWAVFARPGT